MSLQIIGKFLDRLGFLAGSSEQELPDIQIHEECDVVMTAPTADFIDTNALNLGHFHHNTRFDHIIVYHTPQDRVGGLTDHVACRQDQYLPHQGHDHRLKE